MKWRQKKPEKRTVLFVDDDEVVLQSLQRGLLDESYNKLFVKSCNEALEILQQLEVHVIVADMRMPEMTGLELLRNVKENYPDIVGMILSGYEQDAALQTAVDQGEIFKLIPKPWKYGEMDFETLVRRAIEHYNLQCKSGRSGRRKREKCKAKL
jgi:two-component system NtrC family sensor kinase